MGQERDGAGALLDQSPAPLHGAPGLAALPELQPQQGAAGQRGRSHPRVLLKWGPEPRSAGTVPRGAPGGEGPPLLAQLQLAAEPRQFLISAKGTGSVKKDIKSTDWKLRWQQSTK